MRLPDDIEQFLLVGQHTRAINALARLRSITPDSNSGRTEGVDEIAHALAKRRIGDSVISPDQLCCFPLAEFIVSE